MVSPTSLSRMLSTYSNPNPLKLLIIGAPGSGKGTISEWICRDYEMTQVSSGNILRSHIINQTDVGKAVENTMAQGGLVDDKLVAELVVSELETKKIENWLLDGFPRTVQQASILGGYLNKNSQQIDAVISLDVPHEVIIDRIKDRVVHVPSGRVYNLKFSPPQVPGIDDVTGEKLTKRADDTEEAIRSRLEKFQKDTKPVLDFYSQKKLLFQFSGETSKEIYPKISAALRQLQAERENECK